MRCVLVSAAGAALVLMASAPAVGQGSNPSPAITLSAGGVVHTAFQRHDLLVYGPEASEPERLRRELRAESAAAAGMSVSGWLWPGVGIRLAASHAPSRLRVEVSGHEAAGMPDAGTELGEGTYAPLDLYFLDAALMLRLPALGSSAIVPYLLIGGGAVAYRVTGEEPLPPGGPPEFRAERPVRGAGLFGAGVLAALRGDRLALRFELTDHLVPTPIQEVRPERWHTPDGVMFELGPVAGPGALDGRVRFTNHVRLTLGLSVGLGPGRVPR
jgi:hypothetical protein